MTISTIRIEFEDIGSFDELDFVLCEAIGKSKKRIRDIKDYCLDSKKFIRINITEILDFFCFIDYVEILENFLEVKDKGKEYLNLKNNDSKADFLITSILDKLKSSVEKTDYFFDDFIIYDEILHEYIIDNDSIGLNFSGVKNLLINLGFFKPLKLGSSSLVVDQKYILGKKDTILTIKNKVSQKSLIAKLQRQAEQGRLAEQYVLSYEIERLKSHKKTKEIEIVSDFYVNAGYDLLSFKDSKTDTRIYIEVKSYSGVKHFYWSNNEIATAREKGNMYFLYLVDINRIEDKGYMPEIIQNPITLLDDSSWKKECKSLNLTKVQNVR